MSYRVIHRCRQAKFAYGGLILGSSQCTLLPQLPLKMMLDSKVVKIDSNVIILLRYSKSETHSAVIEWRYKVIDSIQRFFLISFAIFFYLNFLRLARLCDLIEIPCLKDMCTLITFSLRASKLPRGRNRRTKA